MILAKIRVTGVYAQTVAWQEIPARISGAMVEIEYADPLWDKLDKTVVFRGCVTRDILRAGTLVQIPPECVEMPGASLKIGVYGTDLNNTVAIPTLWADLGRVRDATDPSGDESTVEALPVWAQILALIGDLDDLATEAKATLVAAINEAATKGGGSVSEEEVWAIVDRYLQENPPVFAETDPTVPSWAKQPQKPSYSAQEVGAEPAGTAAAAVSGHNASTDAHNDLRLELKAINDRLTAFFDSDDKTLDELSEIVAYITGNKSLIDAITTSKVSVSDIVDNLTTNTGNRPLSAAQGVVLKGLIDTVSRSLSNYQPKGDYLGREELPEAVNDALAQAKASGEFKGDPGTPGKDGAAGKDGYTPVKGVDYFDGKDGADGNGIKSAVLNADYTLTLTFDDGTSYTTPSIRGATGSAGKDGAAGKDGTSVTVKSVSESNADGGSNVVTFSDGKKLTVKNGSKGNKGDQGVGIKSVEQTFAPTADDTYNVITVTLTDGTTKQFSVKNGSKGSTGATGKTAYEYARDGGYAGTEAQFAEKLAAEFPTTLPSPHGLSINGKHYDGSAPVVVSVEGGGSADMGASGGEPGWVKRREFYDEPDKTVADNVTVTNAMYSWISYDIVADHETATVIYDGKTYVCPINFRKSITENGDESYFYIGNFQNNAPEYPFFVWGYVDNASATVNVGEGSHTISVTLNAILKQIDPKFIPSVGKVIVPETSIPLNEYAIWTGGVTNLTVGKKYIVTIDGTEYEREAKYSELWECNYVGSVYLSENGEPENANDDNFCFLTYENDPAWFAMTIADYANKTVTLSVKEKASGGSGGVSSWNDLTDRPTDPAWREIANTVETSEYSQAQGCFAFRTFWDTYISLDSVPETISVMYDGVLYENLKVTTIPGVGDFIGNLYYLNAMPGASFENTGEPFICVVSKASLYFITMDTTPTEHSVKVSTYCKPMTTLPLVDLTKYIDNIEGSVELDIADSDYVENVYWKLKQHDTVMLKVKIAGNGAPQTVVAHPIHEPYSPVYVRCFICDRTITSARLLSLDVHEGKVYALAISLR